MSNLFAYKVVVFASREMSATFAVQEERWEASLEDAFDYARRLAEDECNAEELSRCVLAVGSLAPDGGVHLPVCTTYGGAVMPPVSIESL